MGRPRVGARMPRTNCRRGEQLEQFHEQPLYSIYSGDQHPCDCYFIDHLPIVLPGSIVNCTIGRSPFAVVNFYDCCTNLFLDPNCFVDCCVNCTSFFRISDLVNSKRISKHIFCYLLHCSIGRSSQFISTFSQPNLKSEHIFHCDFS